MSVIGPEFYNFIKKLEDNGDKLIPATPVEQPIEFEFNVRNNLKNIIRITYKNTNNISIFITYFAHFFRILVAMFAMGITVQVLGNQSA